VTQKPPAAFAIPGDLDTRTGGYIYERRLLEELRASGRQVDHLRLGASFPDPTAAEMASAVAACASVPADRPLIIDGLVFGAIDTAGLGRVRAPVVAMIHHPLALEAGLTERRAAHLEAREHANLGLAAHVVVPSPHTAEVLRTRYDVPAEKITLALPGVDRPAPLPDRSTGTGPLQILAVGILHPRKGHDLLLDALAMVSDRPWQALIVGKPHDADYALALREQRDVLGLAGRVGITGELDDAALDAAWRSADVFALETRYEGYGMVFAEAQVRGLPIVSCRVGAVPDTVPPETGLLAPPDDPVAFAESLARLLDDAVLRQALAEGSLAAGAALPRWQDTAAAMEQVLDRLAEAR